MIQIHDLTITHNKDLKILVKQLSFVVNSGDKLAIIGEEGNGKSTLLSCLMSENLVSNYAQVSGQILRHFSRYAYLPQSLPAEAGKCSLSDYFFGDMEADLDYGLVYRLAKELGFDSQRLASSQTLSSLSGGERLKVQLIKALAQPYEILFLDEPSNDLDLDTLLWLQNFIASSPTTIVFISHDPAFLAATANKVLHLELLKKKREARATLSSLDYESYARERQLRFDKESKQAKKDQEEHDKKLVKHHRIHQSVQHNLRQAHDSTMGRLLAKKMKAILAQGKRYEREGENLTQMPEQESSISLFFDEITPLPASQTLLLLEDFQLLREDCILADQLHLHIRGQDKIGLVGKNGAGKSSLLDQIRKLLQGKSNLKVGFMPQDYDSYLPLSQKPLDFLAPSGEAKDQEQARTHLASLNFRREEIDHPISQLSGGQKAKLLLLHLVLLRPQFLLLDEPTRNLSPLSHPEVTQLFVDFPGAIFCVSHDREFLQKVCPKIYELTPQGLLEVDIY